MPDTTPWWLAVEEVSWKDPEDHEETPVMPTPADLASVDHHVDDLRSNVEYRRRVEMLPHEEPPRWV